MAQEGVCVCWELVGVMGINYLDHSVKSPFGVESLRGSPEMVKPPKMTQSLPELAQLSQVF